MKVHTFALLVCAVLSQAQAAPSAPRVQAGAQVGLSQPTRVALAVLADHAPGDTTVAYELFKDGVLVMYRAAAAGPPRFDFPDGLQPGTTTLAIRAFGPQGATMSPSVTLTVTGTALPTSPHGTRLPPTSPIIDSDGLPWTVVDGRVFRNGRWVNNGRSSAITWCRGAPVDAWPIQVPTIRIFGTEGWYRFTGDLTNTTWALDGPVDPCTKG